MALPKWTDERTQQLTDFVGSESPITQATVANAADELETSTSSVSSKLRKMGFDVELASASASKSFSEDQEATFSHSYLTTRRRTHMQKLHQTLKADTSQLNQSKEKSYQWN